MPKRNDGLALNRAGELGWRSMKLDCVFRELSVITQDNLYYIGHISMAESNPPKNVYKNTGNPLPHRSRAKMIGHTCQATCQNSDCAFWHTAPVDKQYHMPADQSTRQRIG